MNVLRRMLAFSAASCFLLTSSVVGGQWFAPEFITSDTAYAAQNFDYDEDLVMHYTSEAGTKKASLRSGQINVLFIIHLIDRNPSVNPNDNEPESPMKIFVFRSVLP